MQQHTHGAFPKTAEQFDLNTAKAAGVISKVWGRGGDIFARLRLNDDEDGAHVTLRIPNGLIRGEALTLQTGQPARVEGYLAHVTYAESLRHFLDKAGEHDFFERQVPPDDLDLWRSITFRRQNALLNVSDWFDDADAPLNFVDIEGVVAKVWEYPREHGVDLFARIACYDAHAPQGEGTRNFGRVTRLPHYLNIRFPGGQTANGSAVAMRPKQRIRARGCLRDGGRPVSLRDQLNALGSPQVLAWMNRVHQPELLSQISARYESLHILAKALVVYSR